MADHVRTAIRDAVLLRLEGLRSSGYNVFVERDLDANPLSEAELGEAEFAALVINDDGEQPEIVSLGQGRLLNRVMRLTITAVLRAGDELGRRCDDVLAELETAIGAAGALGGAKFAHFAAAGERETSQAGEQKVVRQPYTFEFHYMTTHRAPTVAL